MSNYRDDTIETLVVSDHVWAGVIVRTEEMLKLSIAAFFTLMVVTTESLVASDSVLEGNLGFAVNEVLKLQDEVSGQRHANTFTYEKIVLRDSTYGQYLDHIEEQIAFNDQDKSIVGSRVRENLNVADSDHSKKYITLWVIETLKVKDSANLYLQDRIEEDSIKVADSVQGKLAAKSFLTESIAFEGSDISSVVMNDHVVEVLRIESQASGRLYAINYITDTLLVSDEILQDQLSGQAWTANTDTWAMSRYAPYSFEGVSVINDQLYAWNDQGVFRMGAEGEEINALVQTGKLDFGEALTHPNAAFMEYQLSGENKQLDIAITTTQAGTPATYTYILPKEQSDYLTNGRVVFGRGLRGRHFSFAFNIRGTSAQLNSLSFEHTPTARRT